MISRRGLFKMLGAVAAGPALKPFAKLIPETYTTYLLGKDALVSIQIGSWGPNTIYKSDQVIMTGACKPLYFRCGTGEMGKLYWSREKSEA